MPIDLTVDVEKQLDALVDQLSQELDGRVPRNRVERTVRRVRHGFADPPVKQFLPILVERQVRAVLAA